MKKFPARNCIKLFPERVPPLGPPCSFQVSATLHSRGHATHGRGRPSDRPRAASHLGGSIGHPRSTRPPVRRGLGGLRPKERREKDSERFGFPQAPASVAGTPPLRVAVGQAPFWTPGKDIARDQVGSYMKVAGAP